MLRVLAALLLIVPLAALAAEPERLALVVGASDYEQDRASREAAGFLVPPRLHNAVRDAELVSEALAGAGFTVARLDNPSRRQLVSGIGQLPKRCERPEMMRSASSTLQATARRGVRRSSGTSTTT